MEQQGVNAVASIAEHASALFVLKNVSRVWLCNHARWDPAAESQTLEASIEIGGIRFRLEEGRDHIMLGDTLCQSHGFAVAFPQPYTGRRRPVRHRQNWSRRKDRWQLRRFILDAFLQGGIERVKTRGSQRRRGRDRVCGRTYVPSFRE